MFLRPVPEMDDEEVRKSIEQALINYGGDILSSDKKHPVGKDDAGRYYAFETAREKAIKQICQIFSPEPDMTREERTISVYEAKIEEAKRQERERIRQLAIPCKSIGTDSNQVEYYRVPTQALKSTNKGGGVE